MRVALAKLFPASNPWQPVRPALAVDVYRVCVGSLLCAYFVALFAQLPGLWPASPSIAHSQLPSTFQLTRALGLDTSLPVARGWLAASVLLACAVTAGVRPRMCAALLLLSCVALSRCLHPITSLEDHLACVASFWLCLLPTGGTLSHSTWRARDRWHLQRVEGWTACVLMLHMLLLLLDADLWTRLSPSPAVNPLRTAALCVVAGCLVMPSVVLRAVGLIGLCGVNVWLARFTELRFAHAFVAASVILFWGAPSARRPRFAVTLPATIGFCAVALCACLFVADKARADSIVESIAAPLWDAGLLPRAPGRKRAADGVLQLRAQVSNGSAPRELHARDLAPGIRAELMLDCLAAPAASSELRHRLTDAVVALHCAQADAEAGELWLRGRGQASALAWYECDGDHGVRHVVLAEPARAQETTPRQALHPTSEKPSSTANTNIATTRNST